MVNIPRSRPSQKLGTAGARIGVDVARARRFGEKLSEDEAVLKNLTDAYRMPLIDWASRKLTTYAQNPRHTDGQVESFYRALRRALNSDAQQAALKLGGGDGLHLSRDDKKEILKVAASKLKEYMTPVHTLDSFVPRNPV
jgi:hypothetical protein